MIYFVYVLNSILDKKYYIGCTGNIERRIDEHVLGKVKSTKHRRPLKLVYFEKYNSLKAARFRELQIKKMKGGNQFKELLKLK